MSVARVKITVTKMSAPPARHIGRPRVGSYRLQCMLPAVVIEELVRIENESGDYRTRVAANVLCEWAQKQQLNRLHD